MCFKVAQSDTINLLDQPVKPHLVNRGAAQSQSWGRGK